MFHLDRSERVPELGTFRCWHRMSGFAHNDVIFQCQQRGISAQSSLTQFVLIFLLGCAAIQFCDWY